MPGIDTDLTAMRAKVQAGNTSASQGTSAASALQTIKGRPTRPSLSCEHTPPESFRPGKPLSLTLLTSPSAAGVVPASVRLMYRHVTQAERWTSVETTSAGGRYTGTIPAEYTNSEYPLEYYFVLEDGKGAAWMFPGFNSTLSNQPYFAVYKRNL